MKKHYLEVYYPGSFFPETSVQEVKERDVEIDLPKGAYAYRYFDREETEINGEILKGNQKNESKIYIAGEVFTVKQLEKQFPKERILISNVKGNGYKKAIRTVRGNWQPFGDAYIHIKTKVKA